MQQLNLSVVSCGSVDKNWQRRPKKPIISKIIKRQDGNHAFILTQDPSKPLRFLYLILLTQKNSVSTLKQLLTKIKRISQSSQTLPFISPTLQMQRFLSFSSMVKNLELLQSKFIKDKDPLLIFKLAEIHETVDPLLVLALRCVAFSEQPKIKDILDCQQSVSIDDVYAIGKKFGIERKEKNQLNRFVLFCDAAEIDLEFFRQEGIIIQDEQQNFEELFDSYVENYQEEIVLEQLYSDL